MPGAVHVDSTNAKVLENLPARPAERRGAHGDSRAQSGNQNKVALLQVSLLAGGLDIAREKKLLSEKEIEEILDPVCMTAPQYSKEAAENSEAINAKK